MEDFYMAIHPNQFDALMSVAARTEYKHNRWVERYNRWRANKGLSPYREIDGELGFL